MSDLNDYTTLLTRTGVIWKDESLKDSDRVSISVNQGTGPKNTGYNGFFTMIEFDLEGRLVKFGAWE